MRHEESKIQQNCVKWFRLRFPEYRRNLFAVPNGGARRPIEGAIMKMEGTLAGVSDLILLVPSGYFHGLCIEMKTAKGRQQDTQKAFQEAVEAVGYGYIICRSFDDFRLQVEEYLRLKIDIPFCKCYNEESEIENY